MMQHGKPYRVGGRRLLLRTAARLLVGAVGFRFVEDGQPVLKLPEDGSRFVSSVFFVNAHTFPDGDEADVFAVVFSDDPTREQWTSRCRWRFYAEDRVGPFENDDLKVVIERVSRDAETETRKLLRAYADAVGSSLDEVILSSADGDEIMGRLDAMPWAHGRNYK